METQQHEQQPHASPPWHKSRIKTPHTPPYTPLTHKNAHISRSASPASSGRSIHPTETSSPARKIPASHVTTTPPTPAQQQEPTLRISELTDADAIAISETELIHPQELEEAESPPASPLHHHHSPSSPSSLSSDQINEEDEEEEEAESDTNNLTTHLSHLQCNTHAHLDSPAARTAQAEAAFERARRAKHLRKRRTSRTFKRTHAESVADDSHANDANAGVGGDVDGDVEAWGDQDRRGSARRLRRRTRGPERGEKGEVRFAEASFGVGMSPVWGMRGGVAGLHGVGGTVDDDDDDNDDDNDAMDVDAPE